MMNIIIDLSKGTFNKIGDLKDGLIKVKIEVYKKGEIKNGIFKKNRNQI